MAFLRHSVRSVPEISVGKRIGADVKLAVEAFSQDQQGKAMNVEVVAASGTSAYRNQKGGQHQEDQPDAEKSSHGSVSRRYAIQYNQCRDIEQHRGEKECAAASGLFKDITVRHRVDRLVVQLSPPALLGRGYFLNRKYQIEKTDSPRAMNST
jgi:hypothetical protein